jgi:3-hydroxyacyl-CoA dehydrogenase/enoyl-CoA hydratase/3-hydroxybutyryl-CoA epimerase
VASTEPETRLGFPEIRLGIFPGFGGTVRSVQRMGHLRALELMLSARNLDARAAHREGLVELAVPRRQLRNAARQLIRQRPALKPPPLLQRLAGLAPLRPLVAAAMKRQVRRRARPDHYPAPYRLIDHWRRTAGRSSAMYESEARNVAALLTGETAQNLIRVFLLQDRLKSLAAGHSFPVRHVHVVGGGVMGGDIAAWCSLKGLRVTLQDRAPEYLTRAVQRAHQLFHKRLKDRYLVQEAIDRFIPDPAGDGAARAEVVIEAIFEDADAKRQLYASLEPRMKADALLATNTSGIPLELLAQGLERPQRFVGLHFFNPVAKMPLVEIVHGEGTPQQTLGRTAAFAKGIGKLPLPVKSRPGFLVNRVLMPYLVEAVILYEEGVRPELIDEAALAFGMPMGPMELADTVGLDIALSVAHELAEPFALEVPGVLSTLVEQGHLGRKSGRGFYRWEKGRPRKEKVNAERAGRQEYSDRMILRLVNEAVACLREGIVEEADLVDAGIVFGTGFAPFRGGPLHWAVKQGVELMVAKLEALEQRYGERFRPDDGWESLR